MTVKFSVNEAPQGKARPRIIRRGGKVQAYTPEKTRVYERTIAAAYRVKYNFQFQDAVAVLVHAYYGIPKSASSEKELRMISGEERPLKKPDADNILKAVLDALNGVAYRDDSQVVEATVKKYYSKIPHIDVFITGGNGNGDFDRVLPGI